MYKKVPGVVLGVQSVAQDNFNEAHTCWERKLSKHDQHSHLFWCQESIRWMDQCEEENMQPAKIPDTT